MAMLEVRDLNESVAMLALKQGLRNGWLTFSLDKNFQEVMLIFLSKLGNTCRTRKVKIYASKRKASRMEERRDPVRRITGYLENLPSLRKIQNQKVHHDILATTLTYQSHELKFWWWSKAMIIYIGMSWWKHLQQEEIKINTIIFIRTIAMTLSTISNWRIK